MSNFYSNNPARNAGALTSHAPATAPITYFGVLKRWNGTAWERSKLMIYDGASFINAVLKIRVSGSWSIVNTTGV